MLSKEHRTIYGESMTTSVSAWLDSLGLKQYARAFEENEIDFDELSQLDHSLLKELGVHKVGHRLAILKALTSQRENDIGSGLINTAREDQSAVRQVMTGNAERRQLTVMFCDIVGSTEISSKLDPEDFRELVRSYQRAAEEAIRRFDGYVAQLLGDGVLAYFGYPVAHEDDAIRAAHSALELLDRIQLLGKRSDNRYGVNLEIRIGIHTGPVVVGDLGGETRTENLAIGETPNVAARFQGLAQPGAAVVSGDTRRLIGEVFELTSLGRVNVKGISSELVAFQLGQKRLTETRFGVTIKNDSSPMMGRKQELALVLDRWRQAKAGEGQVVVLSGEAGIGKSRFVSVLISELAASDPTRISYQCSPYHTDTALFPAQQHLAFAAKFNSHDSAETKLKKLEELLHKGQGELSNSVPLLGALVGIGQVAESKYGLIELSAQERREQSLMALIQQLVGLSYRQPVLFILEDAHWIDPSTLELIERALEEVAQCRILILITARPNFQHGFGGHPIVSRLTLNRLGRKEVVALVSGVTRGKKLPPQILEEIADKTDGVPLYVEELTKSIIESDALREAEGGYLVNQEASSIQIPSSLHDSLIARLDRLDSIKEVAQTAACIGREFQYELLSQTLGQPKEFVDRALNELTAAELVFRRGPPTNAVYTFKHALVRDAAYESILKSRRVKVHDRIFNALQADDESRPELLAQHALSAGRTEDAIKYWEMAGDNSRIRAAFHEACGQYERTIECFESLDNSTELVSRKLDVVVKMASASMTGFGYAHPTTVKANTVARKLLDDVKKSPHRFPILYGSWVKNHVGGNVAHSMVDSEEMCREADRSDDRVKNLIAYRVRGATNVVCANHDRADTDFERVLSIYDEDQDSELVNSYANDPGIGARVYWAISLLCRGQANRAWELIEDCERKAFDAGHVNSYVYTLFHLAWLHDLVGTEESNRLPGLLLDFANENELTMWKAYGHAMRATQLARLNDKAESADEMALAIELCRVTGTRLTVPYFFASHVLTLTELGRYREADAVAEKVTQYVDEGVDPWSHAEIRRLLCIARFRRDNDVEAALNSLQIAANIAASQGASLWELRIATNQATMHLENQRGAEGRRLLSAQLEDFPSAGLQLKDVRIAREIYDSMQIN